MENVIIFKYRIMQYRCYGSTSDCQSESAGSTPAYCFKIKENMISNFYKKHLKAVALEYLQIEEEYLELKYLEDGHSGTGYYAWDKEYPEDGSVLIEFKDVLKFYFPFLFRKDKEIYFS